MMKNCCPPAKNLAPLTEMFGSALTAATVRPVKARRERKETILPGSESVDAFDIPQNYTSNATDEFNSNATPTTRLSISIMNGQGDPEQSRSFP